MIFFTVGSNMPFNRMQQIIDDWAGKNKKVEIYGQIGKYINKPKNFKYCESMPPSDYVEMIKKCDIVVSHAGMGSILTAMKYEKPIIIFPRRADLKEHRNEHQIHTINKFKNYNGVYTAIEEKDFKKLLKSQSKLSECEKISHYASDSLIGAIKEFIEGV